jgi:amino acid adenylation domain-containing protein/FkbH-like protein
MSSILNSTTSNGARSRRELLEERLRQAATEPEAIPLSFAQQRLWVLDQLEPNSPLYNVPLLVQMNGALNVAALQDALHVLVSRHEILRTRFPCTEERPVQIVEDHADITIHFRDLTSFAAGDREAEARRLVRAEVNRPFDLSSGPLLRAALLRLGPEEHWFALSLHHIVSDEWSLQICFQELTALYEASLRNAPPALAALPIQYADYAVWQRDWLRSGVLEKQMAYWRRQLQNNPPVLELAADQPRPAVPTFRGGNQSRVFPPELSESLNALAARHGVSLFLVLLAAFKALLHRYTQQEDILIGSPIAGRNRIETESLIGFFVNTLVLRTDLSGNPTFEELLRRVRDTMLDACANQDLPFEKLVEELRPERTLDHMPFSRVMFAVQKNGLDELQWPGLTLRFLEVESDTAKFDLTVVVQETARGLIARAEFNRDLFNADTIARLLEHFQTLLACVAAQPQQRLAELPLLTPGERQTILVGWNASAITAPPEKSITQLLEEQVRHAPDTVAVVFGNDVLTWRELNSRANQLARHLRNFSVGPGVSVALCLERSTDMIVALAGILKAGGAYVPLDPGYPKPRLAFMLQDAKAPVLLTQRKLLDRLPRNAAHTICLDSDWELIAHESRDDLPNVTGPQSLAYIIYTSGSTGQPKGVAVPHRAVIRLVLNTNYVQVSRSDCIAQASNASFDAATFEIWGALLNGATLIGIARDLALSPKDFARELRERKVSVLFLTTALFNQLAAEAPTALETVRVVMFGGELVDTKWVRAILEHPPRHLLHVYGPTENTTFSTWHEVKELSAKAHTVPIGKPIANTQCYILDAHLNPVPVGVPGELHLAGDGLALGYWNQPELTARQFIPNPFSHDGRNPLLYKTGDLARWLPDGAIEFIGRLDQQVKIRGFRIELGEIETILAQHPKVRDCAVTIRANGASERRLAAYFVPDHAGSPGVSELRHFLKERVPDYMVPSAFIRLKAMPLTPNGKVDRDALPEPDRTRPELDKRYASPRDAVETELVRIWENVLGVHPVGIEDKFFELGGHSLLAVRVIVQIEKAFSRKLRLATIFQAQTIEQLAAILRKEIHEDTAISGTSLVEIQPKGSRPPIFFVHGAGGGMFWGYVNVSRHLGDGQPVYGIRSRESDGPGEFQSVETMASQYLADVRAVQPHGPYFLGGYCFGGNVAYEMARQLQEQGEQVAMLALFNCAPANSRYWEINPSPAWALRFLVNLGRTAKYFLKCTGPQRRDFIRWKKEMLKRRAGRWLGQPLKPKAVVDPGEVVDLSSYSADQRQLWENHILALVNYHAKPYAGRVHLFRSAKHPLLCSFDSSYGWGHLARRGVEVTIVPGAHEKILEEPCVQVLAKKLKRHLADACETGHRNSAASTSDTDPAPAIPKGEPLRLPPEGLGEAVAFPLDQAYAQHFEARVLRTPDAVALRFENSELTFTEVNVRANQLAHYLKQIGVGPESPVGICLERSLELPVALLAVLKAGGACLPLDRSSPAERLRYLLADSGARVILTGNSLTNHLNAGDLAIVRLDDPEQKRRIDGQATTNPAATATPDNLAYVIYTSGSTGAPKGVEITHRSLLNHNFAIARAFGLGARDRVLQFSPFSFDVSLEELLPAWLCGGAVVLRPESLFSSPAQFMEFAAKERLTVLNLPTAYWHELVEAMPAASLPPSVRLVVVGSEKALDEDWHRWKKHADRTVTLINAYGPTETTITTLLHVARPDDDTLPIGRPIANTQAFILDAQLAQVPPGGTGELHIGGLGLARGYLNRPELNAEKFVSHPWLAGERLYKTGDLARLRPDGSVEFVGRTDDQVKIRGFRIEPGEIESVLCSHPDIGEAVVLAREDVPGKKKLVAYFVPRPGRNPAASELSRFLKSKLPPYMVPASLVRLEAIPRTVVGKVDRRALPPPGQTRPELDQQYVAPRTPVEEIIAGIWSEVLGVHGVGIHDSFFDLGGHSLLATQVISRIREALHVAIPLTALFELPTVAALAERLGEASHQAQPALPASVVAGGKQLPLTPAQQRIWFLDQFEPHQSPYNIPTAVRLKGTLDVPALEKSLTALARRHEALRAVFPAEDGLPAQIICEPREIHLPIIDLRELPDDEREARTQIIAAQEGRKAYVMSSPVLRPLLLQLGDTNHLLLLVTHQIAVDAGSVRLLLNELVKLYESMATGTPTMLPFIPSPHAEIISSNTLTANEESEQLACWKRQLEGAPALLELPTDRSRPAHQNDAGARQPIRLSAETTQAIQTLAGNAGCDPFVVLLAAFQTLLARYTSTTDIVVGSTVSNRDRAELQNLVGKFDNLIALRGDLSGDPTFSELLVRVRETTLQALLHRGVSFARVLETLRPPRNGSYTPVFQVMFDYADQPRLETEAAGVRFVPVEVENQTAKLDLKLYLASTANGLSGWIEYSTTLFDADRISRMIEHFETLLSSAIEKPDQHISTLPLMSEKEAERVLVEWNATEKPFPSTSTIHQLFEAQVERSPDAIALVAGNDRLTYRELNARANQIAHYLRSLGVKPGVLAGICLERSWRLIAGILGVLKAGGAYVPLDPAYPRERLAFILQDAQAPVLVTQDSLQTIAPPETAKLVRLDSDSPLIRSLSTENPAGDAASSDLAYVIYTSGSTGRPKGVSLEHRSAVAFISWARDVFTADELAGVLASTSICFDLSIFEMFVPLSFGGTVVLAENALALPALPAANQVTLINTVPSAIRELVRVKGVPDSVRVVNLAGEALATTLVNQIHAGSRVQKVYDLYGPSETTTYSTFTLRQLEAPATIGRPLANEQVYLLDSRLQPVPIGVPGELHIGGVGLARGYLNRPELTAEKFIANPFAPGTRLYKTGDLARWRADGNLEYLGRLDHQVKIRGFRIELGEVEAAFRKHPALREVVVVALEEEPGNKRLAAYAAAVAGKSITSEELRRFGKERLPEYMVPSVFVFLEALPLTPNGKVNRKALPKPQQMRERDADFVAPATPVEEQLAAIWREVLRVGQVGVHDNFFELGGHSLLAIQVISRVRETFKVELPLFALFESPTIALLAKGLASGEWTQNQLPILPMQPAPRDGRLPVSFVQERLWFLDQVEPGTHAYNVPIALRLQGRLDIPALERAFNEIVNRHEALRTTLIYQDGELIQQIAARATLKIETADFESVPIADRNQQTHAWLQAGARQAFDLSAGPLIRVRVARLSDADHALLVVMHHTVSDGWSLTILFQELEALYDAFTGGKPAPSLPVLSAQYADFAFWKRQWMQGPALDQELNFWKEKLRNAPASLELPADQAEPEKPSHHADRQVLHLSAEMAGRLATFAHRSNSTPFAVLLTALTLTFQKWTRQHDMVIGTVVAGRTRQEMENVIGCFMNFLPIRARVVGNETAQELLGRIRTAVLEAQSHQDCPFEKIVEAVNPERRLNRNPLYNVALLLQNFPTEMFRSRTLQVSPLPIELHAALLDLRFEAEVTVRGLSLVCEYKTELFNAETITQLLSSCRQILEQLLQNPGARVSEFAITAELDVQSRSAVGHKQEQTVAVAATFTAEPVEESLRHWMKDLGISARVEFAPYNQVFQQLLDPAGVFATNAGGLNTLLIRLEDWLGSRANNGHAPAATPQNGSPAGEIERVAAEFVSALKSAASVATAPFLVVLCPSSSAVESNPEIKNLLERIEKSTAQELDKAGGIHVVTSRELLELYPVAGYYDASGDELGHVPYTPIFFTALGTMIVRKFHALRRTPHKAIVLDCDQTLWAGVCGEDGAQGVCLDEPRRALQNFMRAQHDAGRLLAVCSKNNEEDVREVFTRRPDMPLRLEHFAALRTNWLSKSENIRSLAQELNLGLDSFIFIDDNPVECAEVEANCPEVLVLQLPDDPARIPEFLKHCWAFDVLKLTDEDRKRGERYGENRRREALRARAGGLADFIAGLELKIEIGPMADSQLSRAAQLTQRTNQFNCTTLRRTENEIQMLAGKADVLTVSVQDRFGDYGLVGEIIFGLTAQSLDVETFLLSCRVLGRGVEHAMLAQLGKLARKQNRRWVDLHFHPSAKNKPASDFLQSVGAAFRQPLNGGYVYRFPAEFAADLVFRPQEGPNASGDVPVESRGNRPAESASARNITTSSPKFIRCRAIALEANDAAKIHQAIEGSAAVRPGGQGNHVPPRTEMERRLCLIWEKLLRVDLAGLNDNFFDLGGHSLLAVRLFAELEKLTGRKFPLVTIFQAPTVGRMVRLLEENQTASARSPIVAVQADGDRPPLFLVHGVGGDVLWGYANLAKHMDPRQPIYGIKSRGQIGLDEYDRIEDMARYYVEELRAFQPDGPYYLGGYCLGGNVAYEMARQLHAQGERAALVALIDAFPSNAGYERVTWWRPEFYFRFARNLYYWLDDFSDQTREDRRRFVARKARTLGRKLLRRFRKSNPDEVDLEEVIDPKYFPKHELKFWEIHLRALTNHVEQQYPGAVTLIRTRGQPFLCSFEEDFCWSRLAKNGVSVKRIPGSHENIFIEPNVKSLAARLEACLAEARRAAPSPVPH